MVPMLSLVNHGLVSAAGLVAAFGATVPGLVEVVVELLEDVVFPLAFSSPTFINKNIEIVNSPKTKDIAATRLNHLVSDEKRPPTFSDLIVSSSSCVTAFLYASIPNRISPKIEAKLSIKRDHDVISIHICLASSTLMISFRNVIDRANAPPDRVTTSLS